MTIDQIYNAIANGDTVQLVPALGGEATDITTAIEGAVALVRRAKGMGSITTVPNLTIPRTAQMGHQMRPTKRRQV
jgi:hypothetical protein